MADCLMPHNVNQTKSGTWANKTNTFCEAESRCRWCGVCFQWVNSPLQPSSMVLGDTNIPRAWKTMENSDMNEWWEGQCNRNMSQTESLCIHLFQSTEVPFCLILQQIRAEIHLIWNDNGHAQVWTCPLSKDLKVLAIKLCSHCGYVAWNTFAAMKGKR